MDEFGAHALHVSQFELREWFFMVPIPCVWGTAWGQLSGFYKEACSRG